MTERREARCPTCGSDDRDSLYGTCLSGGRDVPGTPDAWHDAAAEQPTDAPSAVPPAYDSPEGQWATARSFDLVPPHWDDLPEPIRVAVRRIVANTKAPAPAAVGGTPTVSDEDRDTILRAATIVDNAWPLFRQEDPRRASHIQLVERLRRLASRRTSTGPSEALSFEKELENVLNRHSKEKLGGDTPDFILAPLLHQLLLVVGVAIKKREEWYGRAASRPVTDAPAVSGPPRTAAA